MNKLYHILSSLGASIDRFVAAIGQASAWLCGLLVLVTGAVVALRYGAGIGAIALQESMQYLHAAIFLLGGAYTFSRGGHVRVDVIYRHLSTRQQAWINIFGGLFLLLPFALCLVVLSWEFVAQAWQGKEASTEADGLAYVYLLKSLIPIAGVLIGLQGIANIIHNTLLLVGVTPNILDVKTSTDFQGLNND